MKNKENEAELLHDIHSIKVELTSINITLKKIFEIYEKVSKVDFDT